MDSKADLKANIKADLKVDFRRIIDENAATSINAKTVERITIQKKSSKL